MKIISTILFEHGRISSNERTSVKEQRSNREDKGRFRFWSYILRNGGRTISPNYCFNKRESHPDCQKIWCETSACEFQIFDEVRNITYKTPTAMFLVLKKLSSLKKNYAKLKRWYIEEDYSISCSEKGWQDGTKAI